MGNEKGKGKKGKKLLWIILAIGCLPLIILFLITTFLLIAFMVIFSDSEDNSISEYGASEIPEEYIPIYQEAGEEYDIDWLLLASIHRIETVFSTIDPMISSAGAEGHTQFMPCTWVGWSYSGCAGTNGNASIPDSVKHSPSQIANYGGYGVDGDGDGKADPFNIYDAVHSTANMLSANMVGSTEDEKLRSAIYTYNHADWYVQEVLFYYDMYSNMEIESGYVEIRGDKAWVVPYTKRISSHFNPNRFHPIYQEIRPHNGMDIATDGVAGKPIVAFMDGTVLYSQYNGGYGNLTIIQHDNHVSTYYAHMMYQGLRHGTQVRAGQTIGYVGNTGDSTAPHLHFEIRIDGTPVNPYPHVLEFLEE